MNFLDAHKLVHDYGAALSKEVSKYSLIFRPLSDFPTGYTIDDLVDAYKLFFAHMIMFNTRTPEQYEQYDILRKFMHMFIDDNRYNKIVTCGKIIKDESFLTKKRYAEVLPILEDYYNSRMKESSQMFMSSYRGEEIEEYFSTMMSVAKESREWLKKSNAENPEKRKENLFNMLDDYCETAYQIAGIPMDYYDTVFFKSFDMLREWVNRNTFDGILTPYKDYIETNK